MAGVPVPSVQFNRSILPVQAVVPGGRSWATTRGEFCGGTIHETAKTAPNTQNARSSSTKTSILCSKCPKTRVPKGKSAQKPRFCARKARKRGFQTLKAHKNLDFVLEKPENEGYEPQKRTKTPILCSKSLKTGVPDPKSAQKCRFCAREGAGFRFGLF